MRDLEKGSVKPESLEDGRSVFSFQATGTRWEIETREPLSGCLQRHIFDRIESFESIYSRFRPDSLVSRVAAADHGGCFDFPDDSVALFDLYDQLYAATEGAVDPLIGRDLELLGYDRSYSLIPTSEHTRAEAFAAGRATWSRDVLRASKTIFTRRPVLIDIGAVGKGYLVDLVSRILNEAGISEFVVDGSGDLRHSGVSSIRVGLEHPFDPSMVIGIANLKRGALCASAVNRRAWGNEMHHVLDGRTGIPVREVVATWAVADKAAIADGLATALFFTSGEQLEERFQFSYVRMFADGRAEISKNFDGELFTL